MDQQVQQPQTPQPRQTVPLESGQKKSLVSKWLPLLIVFIVVSAGAFSGLILSSRGKNAKQTTSALQPDEELPQSVQESFNKTFKDQAEGKIEKNDELDKYAQG